MTRGSKPLPTRNTLPTRLNVPKGSAAVLTRGQAWKKKPKHSQPLDFRRLSADNETRMREAVLASTAATPAAVPAARSPVIYMLTVPA